MKTMPTAALALAILALQPLQAEEAPPLLQPLFERLGGLQGISPLVDDFVDRLLASPGLAANSALDAGRRELPPAYLKFQLTEAFCEMSGGPCVYSGQALKESFSPYRISERDWEAMAGELKQSLDKFGISAVDQAEILDLARQTKADITAGAAPPESGEE